MSLIKKIPVKDLKCFVDISRNAYPSMNINTEDEVSKAVERYTKIQEENKSANIYGLYRDDKLLGGMILYDFNINIFGKVLKAGGVGSVAVDILHKKEKVAKELIEYYLKHYRHRGVNLALLYPFRPDFYRKMGFGYGTKMNQYIVRPSELPKVESKSKIFFLRENDKELVLDCYNRYLNKTHGMIEKSKGELDSMFKNPKNKIIGYKEDGKVKGYVVFSFRKKEGDNFLTNDIYVHEFIYEDSNSLLEIMNFLNTQRDQIRHVIFNTLNEGFEYLLRDVRNGSDNIIPFVYHESNTQGIGLMYRLIDVKDFFENVKYHNFNNETCILKMNIRDSFLKENDRSVIVDFKDGYGLVDNNKEYEVEIDIDISDFSSMILGVVRFKDLFRYGIVNISSEKYIEVVNKIFAYGEKPICITGF